MLYVVSRTALKPAVHQGGSRLDQLRQPQQLLHTLTPQSDALCLVEADGLAQRAALWLLGGGQ